MGRELKDLIIVDNSENSFMFQPANAIHIKSYFDDPEDTELYKLFPFMRFIRENGDVRHVGDKLNYFNKHDLIEIINNSGEKIVYNKNSYKDTGDSSSNNENLKHDSPNTNHKSDDLNIDEEEQENTDRILINHKSDLMSKQINSHHRNQKLEKNKGKHLHRQANSQDFLVGNVDGQEYDEAYNADEEKLRDVRKSYEINGYQNGEDNKSESNLKP